MMTRSLTWNSIFLVHREDAEERQRSMVDHGLEAQEWGSGQPSPHTHGHTAGMWSAKP